MAGGGYPGLITPFGGTLEGGGTFSQGFPEGEGTASWKITKYPLLTLINISFYKLVICSERFQGTLVSLTHGKVPSGLRVPSPMGFPSVKTS